MRSTLGLKRKADDGTYYVRRAVPEDVRHVLKRRELVESLKTTDSRQAELRRDEVWRRWTSMIVEARRTGARTPDNLALVSRAIDDWRRRRCEAALGVEFEESFQWKPIALPQEAASAAMAAVSETYGGQMAVDLSRLGGRKVALSIGDSARRHAERYFVEHPEASRDLQTPYAVGVLLGRLQVAERDPEAWRNVEQFDDQLELALREVGLAIKLSPALLEPMRHPFAKAWLEVVRHEEAARRRAASFLAAIEAARFDAASVRAAAASRTYIPREDDHALSELIDAYRSDRSGIFGAESTSRKYNHIFAALRQALGPDKPIRAITPDDCRKVRDLLRTVPAHMGKRYPGKKMAEAIEAAAEEDEPQLLAPNTINSYLSNLVALFTWATKAGWAELNPASGLVDKNLPLLERRAFEPKELAKVFDGLATEKTETPWKYWVTAIGLCAGARLNEICQLTTDDVCEYEGVHYLRMTVFDPSGRRIRDKRLKTAPSKRNVPLHPHLVDAGFLDYVAKLEPGRLFPELPRGPNGGYSHYASTWFGTYLDRIGLTDPCLVFHSLRHGFKEACQAAEIQDSIWRALGGWAAGDVAERYGRRDMVSTLHEAVKKVRFGGFRLAPAVTGSATDGADGDG